MLDVIAEYLGSRKIRSTHPIPIGAKKVALCFSAASSRLNQTLAEVISSPGFSRHATDMVIMSIAVINISIKRPRAILVPPLNWVRTFKVPGEMASTIAAPGTMSAFDSHQDDHYSPVIPPKIWETVKRQARRGVSAPTKAIPKDTAGLKRPPETRKKIHALTARLKPNAREI